MASLRHVLTLGIGSAVAAQSNKYPGDRFLWYDHPGTGFNNALPIGNGRLGAMMLGSATERIILNEHSVWNGTFQDRINNASLTAFPEVREMLMDGNMTEAGEMVLRDMTGDPIVSRAYSVTNDLTLDFGHSESEWKGYERWLDTLQGNTGLSYKVDDVTYSREIIASHAYSVIAVHLTADKPKSINVKAGLYRKHGVLKLEANTKDKTINLDIGGKEAASMSFASGLRILAEGAKVESDGTFLHITDATEVDLFFDAETEFYWDTKEEYTTEVQKKLGNAVEAGFKEIRSRAIKDHEALMSRVNFTLGNDGDKAALPTDQRIKNYKTDASSDWNLITLMLQYGRHLLISSSREGSPKGKGVPANLQGLWNENYSPSWGSKFTSNINVEMNYWLAETTNLADTIGPLWDLMHRGRYRGKDVAKRMYGCPGYVSHHNLDLWGDSVPHDNGTKWSMWPMSNLWLSSHMMEHYRFNGDKEFVRAQAWDLFHDAATFFHCYLFEFEGFTSSGPSSSPENSFWVPKGKGMSKEGAEEAIDISPTMDNSLLYEFYNNLLDMASMLGISTADDEVLSKAESWRDGLRPTHIGSHGQIQEWRNDYEEAEPGHRHLSHLWDLFPGHRMTPLINQTLADAARVSIERRLAAGGGATGWSQAWTAACFARLLDGDTAITHIQALINDHSLDNMLHAISRNSVFQIDSNLGVVAATVELLLQSHAGIVHILPALPSSIASGSVSGIIARGGFEVSIKWENGALSEAKVLSRLGRDLNLRVGSGADFKIDGKAADSVKMEVGKSYVVTLA